MHTVLFSLKRADQRSLRFQRALLEPFGITPARCDMLFVILTAGNQLGSSRCMLQSAIRRGLGVTAVTVCKMLRALEKSKFVTRKREIAKDKRQVLVVLTRKALKLLRRVDRQIVRPGCLWFALHVTLGMTGENVGTLKFWLDRLREGWGDGARFHFPWCDRTLFPRKPRGSRTPPHDHHVPFQPRPTTGVLPSRVGVEPTTPT